MCFSAVTFGQSFIFTQDVQLYFGEMVIKSNTTVSSTTITRQGRVSNTGEIFLISIGNPGEYTLSDMNPFETVNLSANLPVDSIAPYPGTEQLTITAVDMPASLTADINGEATFKLGATLETSGNGGTYSNPASFPFIIELDVTY